MATATDQLVDDPVGFGLDVFSKWTEFHIAKETAKTQASESTAANDQAALIGAPTNVVQRPNAEPLTMNGTANQASPNVVFAGIEFNRKALYVVAAALVVIVFTKVVS